MHPYYGSDRLVSASPTPIESVESQEAEMMPNNGGVGPFGPGPGSHTLGQNTLTSPANGSIGSMHLGPAVNSVQVSGSGVLGSQYTLPNLYPSQYQPTPIVSHSHMIQRAPLYAANSPPTSFNSYIPPTSFNSYIPNSPPYTQTPYIPTSTPFMPVATSTPFVQFMTPSTVAEPLCSYTNRGCTPRVSPTFSTPPIQMAAPQADSVAWQHIVPTSMPWAPVGSRAGIQFTATGTIGTNALNRTSTATTSSRRLVKRKSTFDDNVLPEKVHVNEERMAARFDSLHLDNNNHQWHPDLEDQWYHQKLGATSQVGDEKNKAGKGTTSTLSNLSTGLKNSPLNFSDLLKIGIKSQEILPKIIMDEITRPCMQVVLWKPPGNFVQEAVREMVRESSPDLSTEMTEPGTGDASGGNSMTDAVSTAISLSWKSPPKPLDSSAMDDMEL